MKCYFCGAPDCKVVDSRGAEDDTSIRRRRECVVCGKRFSTRETVETEPVYVVKSDGSLQPFDPQKIRSGILKAAEKRSISLKDIDAVVKAISKDVYNRMESEISSKEIGEMVMERLKDLDAVTYIRYASVYRSFKDISSFLDELQKLLKDGDGGKND